MVPESLTAECMVSRFLDVISSVERMKILSKIKECPMEYTEIITALGYDPRRNSGRTAFHLRKLVNSMMIKKSHNVYHVTFVGQKVCELYQSLLKIAVLGMESPEAAKTSLDIKLERTEIWLAPLLRSEIRKIARELK